MSTHPAPLTHLVERQADAVLFRGPAGAVTAAAFLHDAHVLAHTLPDGAFLVNLCRDRYAFTVAFAAALLRRQVCLLPGDASPARLAALALQYPGCTAAVDAPDPSMPMPGCVVRPTGSGTGADNPALPSHQLAAIVFTSGSTGTPVAHPKLWGALAERSRAAAGAFGLDAAPPTLVGTVPPGHMYGFETTALLPLHAPAASWCGPAFYPGDIAAALAAVPAPRILVTTPLQLRALVGSGAALPPLQAVISATAPLDPALAGEAERRWEAPVMEIFGATEVGSIASRRTAAGDRWTAYPGVDIQAGADGTMVSAPWAGPTPLADDVELEGAGRFRLLGRRADLVKLGGRRASLSGLNRILLELDGVADGAFVVPDDLGQRANARLLAVVVAPRRSAEGILADLRGRMDPLFLPRRVVRVDALPRNELGKLPRQALLAMLQP
jgi:acyl-coenzyme A synthetase/AMP-(fatty) acid ligase